jgi:hypothetical protein
MPITIPYPGGKGRLARTTVSFLPKRGRTFVEHGPNHLQQIERLKKEATKTRGSIREACASPASTRVTSRAEITPRLPNRLANKPRKPLQTIGSIDAPAEPKPSRQPNPAQKGRRGVRTNQASQSPPRQNHAYCCARWKTKKNTITVKQPKA